MFHFGGLELCLGGYVFGVRTAFHTSFLVMHPCLPATIFGQKFSSARNQMLFYRPLFCCLY